MAMRVREVRLAVSRMINLGNYESVKIEAAAMVDDQDDELGADPEAMRYEAMHQVRELLVEAMKEHIPTRRGRE